MKTNFLLIGFLVCIFTVLTNCDKDQELQSSAPRSRDQIFKGMAKAQIQLNQSLASLEASRKSFDWEKFAAEFTTIQDEVDLSEVLVKYRLEDNTQLKNSIIQYAKETALFNKDVGLNSLSDEQKKACVKEYIVAHEAVLNEGLTVANHRNLAECSRGCYNTGLENGLLCALGCTGGIWACWVAVGCEIAVSRQLNRCYVDCRHSYPQEAK